MAFGKDNKTLEAVKPFGAGTSFAQRSQFLLRTQGEQRQKRSGGGGYRFQDIYKPTLSQSGFDLVRLIPGHYPYKSCDGNKTVYEYPLEYWPFIEHFDNRTKRSSICSGGVFHNFKNDRDPCLGCDLFFSTMDTEKGPDGRRKSHVSKQDKFVFNVLHYAPYHKIQQVDDETGKVRTNDKNEPYYEWVPCEGRGCAICPQNVETMEARVLKWQMSFTHYKAMTTAYANAIGEGCRTCASKKSIQSLAWICSTSTGGCGEAVIDLADTTLKDEDIAKISSEMVLCPHCKVTGFLDEIFQCSKCSAPERCSIFDVNMHVKRMESGHGESKQTMLIVQDWSEACGIDPRFTEIAKPFELSKIYAPSPIEWQQKQFQMSGAGPVAPAQSLTRTPVAPGTGFKPYTAPTGSPNFGK